MAIDIFQFKYYFIILCLAPLCFFFPYHAAFGSLALFGAGHILSEVVVWWKIDLNVKDSGRLLRWVFYSAMGLSILSVFPLILDAFGQPPLSFYSPMFLTVFTVWVFVFGTYHLVKAKAKIALSFLWIWVAVFIFLIWMRPSLNYFFLVHVHNLLPWIVVYQLTRNKLVIIPSILVSFLIPFCIFYLIFCFEGSVSNLALSAELEQEIFRQVVHSEFPWVSGTTLLGYFAYQQIIHYFLWIYLIPKVAINKTNSQSSTLNGITSNLKPYHLILPVSLIIVFVLFLLYPVSFRRLYFALGFFHIAIEFPLLILLSIPSSKKWNV